MAAKETNVKAAGDPWQTMVTVKLQKAPHGQENFRFVSVNGRNFKIQKGVEVKVPLPVAEVLKNSYEAMDQADEYLEKITSEITSE